MTQKLNVDLGELALALETHSYEMRYYLDLETGEIILVMDEFSREVERIYRQAYEEGEEIADLEEHLQDFDIPDWQKSEMLDADRVETGHTQRYIRIEWDNPHGDYEDMERFIATVDDPELRERLWRAIRGRGAFRYFKDVLLDHPQVREDWFEFRDKRHQQRVKQWLKARDIEVVDDQGE